MLINEILNDIMDYQIENYEDKYVNPNMLSFKELLHDYLEWNGIYGYDKYIIELILYALPVTEEDLNS